MPNDGGPHPPQAEALHLAPSGGVPNHPALPALVYRGVLPADADAIERRFRANGWAPRWRWGMDDFHHVHVTGHEALGVAAGHARVVLGGPGGPELAVRAGDVLVLPAGTGHRRVAQSPDFLVVGAYPPGQDGTVSRPPASAEDAARVVALPRPAADPVTGELAAACANERKFGPSNYDDRSRHRGPAKPASGLEPTKRLRLGTA